MARIPESELERLKRDISVERLATARGVELKPHGANLIGLCPFHEDHEPSLVITPAKNLWHCLGACQTGGSVIDWVMKAEGISFRHAVELLRSDLPPLAAASSSSAVQRATLPVPSTGLTGLPLLADPETSNAELLRQVVRFYHDTLTESPEALAYLDSRGLRSAEMIDHFQLGFANRTLGYRLPFKTHLAGARLRRRLQDIGILRDSGHEHFSGSLVIPIVDAHGTVTELYGRKITPRLRPGTPLHLYLPGPHQGVWNVGALEVSKEIILCEALLDALTFWCAGFRNVTASYGIEGFTEDHFVAFRKYGTERVLIAYDRDTAGEQAAEKLAEKLTVAGIGCYRVEFPKDMDANDYALKVTPAAHSLGLLLRTARWMGTGAAPAITSVPEAFIVALGNESPAAAADVAIASEPAPAVADAAIPLAAQAPPRAEIPTEIRNEEIVIRLGDRKYRVRGLAKNLSYDVLRVNILAAKGDTFHVDTLDLYSARQRALFIRQAAEDLALTEDVIKTDVGKVLLKLEELQDEQIRQTLAPQEQTVTLSDDERAAALDLLTDPELLTRILRDFHRCGVVGEETNTLVGYLAAVSRKLDEPLAVIIQSSSAAGKSALMEAILAFMPEEQRVKYSAMTGQSLFYMGETDLKHKILAIVEEEGAARASYALKLLQSEGELTIASTGKDPETGKLVTHEYHVEGPVMIFLTTTAIEIDEELLNRCLVLTVNEDREQTRAIHQLQRERQTLEGLLARQDRREILALHQNAQRLLKPLLVANPFARELTFLDTRTRTRRDHMKYLTLIRTIALLHQYQRPVQIITHHGKTLDYIEVTRADIATANRLAHEVLGRSLDELAPQTRRLLHQIDQMVTAACTRLAITRSDYRFSRRDVREHTNIGNTQLKHHLHRLEELEYVLVHRGGRGQSFVYELLYHGEGQDGRPFLIRLINPDDLHPYDEKKSGGEAQKSGASRPQVGAKSDGGRSDSGAFKSLGDKGCSDSAPRTENNAHLGNTHGVASYVVTDRPASASPLAASPNPEP
jgi:DNA primase catalytic core